MSNERNNLGQDPLVTNTYKELAGERTPDHLNEKVLRLAADRARAPYALARAWMRPAAWAATIGLSFAIVLELTQLPQIEPETVGVTASEDSALLDYRANDGEAARRSDVPATAPAAAEKDNVETSDQFAPRDMDRLREAEDRARLQAGPNQVPVAQDSIAQEPVVRQRQTPQAMTTTPKLENDASDVASGMVEKAVVEETAADNVRGFAAARSLSVAAEKKDQHADRACSDESRTVPESWYQCIKALRDVGEHELATSEYVEFRRVFPNFVDPDADK